MTQNSGTLIISLIAAMGNDRVIGIDNRLPWRLPADLKHFRAMTLGKPVLMGRKTFESIGKPLPGRLNIVITQDAAYSAAGVTVVHSVDEALTAAGNAPEMMVMGGASFYVQMLPRAERLYLTLVHGDFAGDAYFPTYDENEWGVVSRDDHAPDQANPHPYSFLLLERKGRR